MYGYEWTGQNGIYRLSVNSKIEKEIRPVFKEELDYFGFNEHWTYPDTDAPLLWAEGIRRYVLNGSCVAEATGGGFYTKPTIKYYSEGLKLEPIDVDALWHENERLMLGLEKTAMDFIRKTHDKYKKQGMAFAVAFSGGTLWCCSTLSVVRFLPTNSLWFLATQEWSCLLQSSL